MAKIDHTAYKVYNARGELLTFGATIDDEGIAYMGSASFAIADGMTVERLEVGDRVKPFMHLPECVVTKINRKTIRLTTVAPEPREIVWHR